MAKHALQPEDFIKDKVRQILQLYFFYKEEVTGIGPMGQRVRIDFWCKPKPEMLDIGLPDIPMGIEVKSQDLEDHKKKSSIRLVYQAILYRNSRFPTKEGNIQPGIVLIYPQISVLLGLGERKENPRKTLEDGIEYSLVRIAGVDRIGEFVIRGSHFTIRVNGAKYFDSLNGLSKANPLPAQTLRASR